MKKLLIWLVYEIDDSNLRNRLYNNLEYVLAFTCAGLTFFNDLIEIAANKYCVEIRVAALRYIKWR